MWGTEITNRKSYREVEEGSGGLISLSLLKAIGRRSCNSTTAISHFGIPNAETSRCLRVFLFSLSTLAGADAAAGRRRSNAEKVQGPPPLRTTEKSLCSAARLGILKFSVDHVAACPGT